MPTPSAPHTGLTQDEHGYIAKYLGREPSVHECAVIGEIWNGRARHTYTRHLLKTIPVEGKHILVPGVADGTIDIGGDEAAVIRVGTTPAVCIITKERAKGLKVTSGSHIVLLGAGEETVLLDAVRELIIKRYCTDAVFVGDGLFSALAELAMRSGIGISAVVPDQVPRTAMIAAVMPAVVAECAAVCSVCGVSVSDIGAAVGTGRISVVENGIVAADIPADILDKVPERKSTFTPDFPAVRPAKKHMSAIDTLADLMTLPVRSAANAVVGAEAVDGDTDAFLYRIASSRRVLAVASGGEGCTEYVNPYRGAKICAAEAYRRIIASGGRPLASLGTIAFGDIEQPEMYWRFEQTVRGLREACIILETPAAGMTARAEDIGAAGTPFIMLGRIDDLSNIRAGHFTRGNEFVYLIGDTLIEKGDPEIDLAVEKKHGEAVSELIKFGLIGNTAAVTLGGLALTLARMCEPNGIGIMVTFDTGIPADELLFGGSQSRYIFSTAPENVHAVEEKLRARHIRFYKLGRTVQAEHTKLIINDMLAVDTDELSRMRQPARA